MVKKINWGNVCPVNLSTFSIHDIPIIAWSYGSHDYRLWNSSTSFYKKKKGCFNKSHINDFCWYTKTSTKRDDEWKNNFIFMVKKRNWGNVCVQPRNAKHTDTSVDSRRGVTKYVASRMHTNAIIIMADWLASPDRGGSISRWFTKKFNSFAAFSHF